MSKRGINGGWSHEEKLSGSFSTEYFKTKQNEKQTKEEKESNTPPFQIVYISSFSAEMPVAFSIA